MSWTQERVAAVRSRTVLDVLRAEKPPAREQGAALVAARAGVR